MGLANTLHEGSQHQRPCAVIPLTGNLEGLCGPGVARAWDIQG